ncbi:RNA polymerase sigma factor (sigma-70 family) [Streptomyces africanus]|uniref:RNA polymerase sigma factor n=1 Tax=Streptomyces africanus TaxID=231024 RepID=A0ABU0QEL0_9ACTN|nr:sigma factor [Streptomyces africanus]MDQ0745819.1 RNA polymerase sigma factor (sigma-70 family) [Streptomyces africanus]
MLQEARSAGTPTVGGGVLAARERSGADAETFIRAVYAQHGRVLLQYAARRLRGDWHRAEDILQEAVVRAWRHAVALGTAPETMRPWLFAVVRNLLIDDHRAQALRPVTPEALEDTDIPVADEVNRLLTEHVRSSCSAGVVGVRAAVPYKDRPVRRAVRSWAVRTRVAMTARSWRSGTRGIAHSPSSSGRKGAAGSAAGLRPRTRTAAGVRERGGAAGAQRAV